MPQSTQTSRPRTRMPVGLYSKACGTCKQRRIKCDEAKPSCGQCQKSKLTCKPFQLNWTFIHQDGAPARRKRSSTPSQSQPVTPKDELKQNFFTPASAPQTSDMFAMEADARLGFEILTHNSLATYLGLHPETPIFWNSDDSKPTSLAHAMQSEPAFAGYAMFLPERFGQDACLDAAINCLFSAVGSAKRLGRNAVSVTCMPQYALALQLLRSSMENGNTHEIGNMAAAVFLMGAYESAVMLPTWKTHLSGLAALYQMAGPSSLTTRFDRAILLASVGAFVELATTDNHHCFLALPIWQSLLYEHLPVAIGQPSIFTHTQLFVSCWTAIPGLLHDCRKIMDSPSESTTEDVEALLAVAWKIRRDLLGDSTEIPTIRNAFTLHEFQGLLSNQNQQNTGNYATFLMVHAMTVRVILSLETISDTQEDLVSLEQQCVGAASEIIELYQRFPAESEPQDELAPVDSGSRFRILHAQYASAIMRTHDTYALYARSLYTRSPRPVRGKQSEHERVMQRIISPWVFCDFHEKLRGTPDLQ